MISCSYNGWSDAPEEEREALDAFEASRTPPTPVPISLALLLRARAQRTRKAA